MKTNKFYINLLVLLSLILLNSCSFDNKKTEQIIKSEDNLFSVTIPKDWVQITDHSLNDEANLQATKPLSNLYFVALMENVEDLEFSFDEWMEMVINSYLEGQDNASISDSKDILINGQPAKQYEIKASDDGVKFTMLATYVNGKNYYAQILAWTLASKYNSSLEELKAITNSIKGL